MNKWRKKIKESATIEKRECSNFKVIIFSLSSPHIMTEDIFSYTDNGHFTLNYSALYNPENEYTYNGKEQVKHLYDYGARYYDASIGRWLSVDPLAGKYPGWSPFNYVLGNPVMLVDPTGMAPDDWVKNKKTGEYIWLNNVTSSSDIDLPKNYEYIGSTASDILNDLNLNSSFPVKSSNRIGYVTGNVGRSYGTSQLINVRARSYIQISANVSINISKNTIIKTFEGIDITATVGSSSSEVNGSLISYSSLFVKYGGRNYTSGLRPPSGTYFKRAGTNLKMGTISIPATNLNPSKNLTEIRVNGGWWVKKHAGRTPVIYHLVYPYPQTFTHTWNPHDN